MQPQNEPNNVDALLTLAAQQDAITPTEPADKPESASYDNADIADTKQSEAKEPITKLDSQSEESGQEGDENPYLDKTESEEKPEVKAASEEKPTLDEYGNEVAKPRMYSEEDVQRMIRERLARGNHGMTQQQINKAASEFKVDEANPENWEAQLKTFIKNTFTEISNESVQKERQAQEAQRQAEFDDKMMRGMNKYNDFVDVVQKQPISDAMLMATRTLDNPAAFIYAAAKMQGAELQRIAKISDPFQQAAEMGRLEEKMRKSKVVTKAPRLIKSDRTDVIEKDDPKQQPRNIESLIDKHARSKLMRRAR